MTSDVAKEYFEFIANLGVTKHPGSMDATRKLIDLCEVEKHKYVLDVGCGVGATPCYLAKTIGCRVMGVDLLEKMVEQSQKRAKSLDVEDLVEFKVADARQLPFEDSTFDVVLIESVNVFFENKLAAMKEYVRVTKPGGYVGFTEMAWLRSPTPEEEEYYKQMVSIEVLDEEGWIALMKEAGLQDMTGSARKYDISQEAKGRFERYSFSGVIKSLIRMFGLSIKDPTARKFLKEGMGSATKEMLEVMGYGVFVGQKPA
jgi:ubiquinone/menaquinone biosynthesis C-methylase UbiE